MSNSMRSYPLNNTKRNITVVVLLAIICICGGLAFAYHHKQTVKKSPTRPVNTVNYNKPNPQDSNASNNNKTGANAVTLNNTPSTSKGTSTSNSTPQTSGISVKIVSLINNGSLVHVGTIVDGTTAGTCKLTGTKDSQTIDLGNTDVESNNNTVGCGVFNVPLTSFPSKGAWTLTVTVEHNNFTANDHGTVTI